MTVKFTYYVINGFTKLVLLRKNVEARTKITKLRLFSVTGAHTPSRLQNLFGVSSHPNPYCLQAQCAGCLNVVLEVACPPEFTITLCDLCENLAIGRNLMI